MIAAVAPYLERGIPLIGLEPSCLLTLRDEYPALLATPLVEQLAEQSLLLEEFLVRAQDQLHFEPSTTAACQVAVHGHCHQKAFATIKDMDSVFGLLPGVESEFITSSCCGMAGAFGYQAESYAISMRMAALSLLPAIHGLPDSGVVVANGTSCRAQIAHGTGRQPLHLVALLDQRLAVN